MGLSRTLKQSETIVLVDDDSGIELASILLVDVGRGRVKVNVTAPPNIEIIFLEDGQEWSENNAED